ncbi:MAG: ABC transporter ATP-binding protein [Candidatus Omnitrophica bacterium]|jgi:subfamily B ATP-binding cassette protein MsbA|nr:ABC transporter ATP-binding protein/permease [Candidatus Omnitrophota bacterium]MDD5079502.1 ABC transporter ATP-binding protein [Candidatus Omnitrophota bacterium]
MRDYIKLFKFVIPHSGLFAGAGICMLLSAIFDGVSLTMIMPLADIILTGKKIVLPVKLPQFLNAFIDTLNNIPPLMLLNYMVIGVVILFVLKGLFGFLQSYFMTDISFLVMRDIRSKLYAKFQTLSLDYFTHRRGGEMMSRVTNDVGQVGNAISYGATDLIYQSLQVVICAFLIFFINAKLALLALVILPLVSLPIVKVGKILKKIALKTQEKVADINSVLYETILGVRVVKAFNTESHEQGKFDKANQAYYKLSMKATKRMLALSPGTELIGIIAGVLVLSWEGKAVIEGKLSFGALAVSLAALLSMLRPFKKLSQVHSIIQQAIAGSKRIYEVLDSVPTVAEKKDPLELDGFNKSVIFEDVWFSYANNVVLRGINLEVKQGEVLAIVGPSGAGKTTLLDLVPRFYDPAKGRILIDGKDLKGLSFKSLRRNIGIVTQETILFNDTIRGNIAYGLLDARQEDIETAAKQAYVHEVVQRLPKGYDTSIGDRGVKLSGGERQRLAIARALLKNAPILILDEATSQLDTESERLVQEALNKLMQGRTVLVIAHRLSTIRHADRIVVLDAGKIIEQGNHEELLRHNGLYNKLYQNQQLYK